jgi:hypothetical protein
MITKKLFGAGSVLLASMLILTGCSQAPAEPKNFSEAITELNTALTEISDGSKPNNPEPATEAETTPTPTETETPSESKLAGIASVTVKESVQKDGRVGLDIVIGSTASNIEAGDWDLLFRTIVKTLGNKQYIYDLAIPMATPTSEPKPDETSTPTPIVTETPTQQELSYIIVSGYRVGGSGETIRICDTTGFQLTQLECKSDNGNDIYVQTLEWNWVKETYK